MLRQSCDSCHAIILTALDVEYKAVRAHLVQLREIVHREGTIYEAGNFSAQGRVWKVALVPVGKGNVSAAFEAERAIECFNPRVALFVGVAGGLKDVCPGDVVAATKVYGYEAGKAGKDFAIRPEVGRSTYSMEQRARAEAKKEDWLRRVKGQTSAQAPQVFVAPIAAGEKVIASTCSSVCQFLKACYSDALAVEMEGHGFLSATHARGNVQALIVRGISNLLDDRDATDAASFQAIAAQNASAFAFEILAKFGACESLNTLYHVVQQAPVKDDAVEGRNQLQKGRDALYNGYYMTARQHLEQAACLLSADLFPLENAQVRYIQALTDLNGKRPFGVTLHIIRHVEELMQVAIDLSPIWSYLYTFALFKRDFARNGWFQARYVQEAEQLILRSRCVPSASIDEDNIALLSRCQPQLLHAAQEWGYNSF